jgi:hypothetical protein
MINVSIFTNEIDADGQLVEHLAAAFRVSGQDVEFTDGDPRYAQIGMPVYSERYGRLIDFDTDGEEWARNLPSAYRNGAVAAHVQEVAETSAHRSAYHLLDSLVSSVGALARRRTH